MDNSDDEVLNISDEEVINISDEELFPHEYDDINITDEELFPLEFDEEPNIPKHDEEQNSPEVDEELFPLEFDEEPNIPEDDKEKNSPKDDEEKNSPEDDEEKNSPEDEEEKNSPEDDEEKNIPEDEAQNKRIVIRGPGIMGDGETFDRYCVFGNVVEMNWNQAVLLTRSVDDLPRPDVKDYVCTLTKENVRPGEGEMEFTPEYTTTYLKKFLMSKYAIRFGIPGSPTGRSRLVSVAVKMKEGCVIKYCRMKLLANGKASVSTGWPKAVKAFNLHEGDICIFSFQDESIFPKRPRDPFDAWIKMEILKLED